MKVRGGFGVKAPPEVVFELLERDRTEFKNDELEHSERVGDLPFGPGYGFRSTVLHGAEQCSVMHRVTICHPPCLLEEEWVHRCPATGKTVTGSQRFEIVTDHAGTFLVVEYVQRRPGIEGLRDSIFGSLCNPARATAARLVMRAEALAKLRPTFAPT